MLLVAYFDLGIHHNWSKEFSKKYQEMHILWLNAMKMGITPGGLRPVLCSSTQDWHGHAGYSSKKCHKDGWGFGTADICRKADGTGTGLTWRRARSARISSTWTPSGSVQREPGPLQWCPVMGPEALSTDWNAESSFWMSGNIVRVTDHWHRVSREAEQIPTLEIYKTCLDIVLSIQLCFNRGVRADDLQKYLQT